MANIGKPIQVIDANQAFGAAVVTTEIGVLPEDAFMNDIKVTVLTAFDSGTSDTLTIGHGAFGSTAADPDFFEAAIDVKTAAGIITLTLLNRHVAISASDGVPITMTYTPVGTAAAAGDVKVIFEFAQP